MYEHDADGDAPSTTSEAERFHPLLDTYNDPSVNRISDLAQTVGTMDADHLSRLYHDLRQKAPRRHRRNKRYFGGRTGRPSTSSVSNRVEEHLAIAIYNAHRDHVLALPGGRSVRLVDYQTPLKERRGDIGVGKLDLFGVIDERQPTVIELKVSGKNARLRDTPLRAFLEGLAYCAIAHGNSAAFADEVRATHGILITEAQPTLIVAAPSDYWLAYHMHQQSGKWLGPLTLLASHVAHQTGVATEFLALEYASLQMGTSQEQPSLSSAVQVVGVHELLGQPTE